MTKQYLSIPFAVDLTEEKAWDKLNNKNTRFFVTRFHFLIESVQLNEPHCIGEKLAVFETPQDASQEYVNTVTFGREDVNIISSIKNSLYENKLVAGLATECAAKVKTSGIGEISNSLKMKLNTEFKNSFSQSYRVEENSKVRQNVSFEIKNIFGPSISNPLVAVPVFQRCAFNMYLAYIDYLLVDYRKKYFGLRQIRKNHPKVIGIEHPNRMRFGVPIARALYWKHLTGSSKFVYENEYTLEVSDPDEIEIVPFERQNRVVEFPNVPTLYQITRAAFPRKWIKRKGDWTEEELIAIECKEAHDSPWWYRHGPGRVSLKNRSHNKTNSADAKSRAAD